MSATGCIWLGAYLILALLTMRRASWGAALYLLTFYAPPTEWWWGQGLLTSVGENWALAAGIIFAIGVLRDPRVNKDLFASEHRKLFWVMGAFALNATLVHFTLAANPDVSFFGLQRVWKFTLFLVLMLAAIRDRYDFKIVLYAIVIGGLYIGYEVYFNDAGHFRKGRLENVPLGAASDANFLSAVLSVSMIYAGYLILCGKRLEKIIGIVSAALILEVVLSSVSRGTTIGLVCGGIVFVVRAPGRARWYALGGLALGAAAALFVMGDFEQERFFSRFGTTFAAEEERDSSAESRVVFWRRAVQFIADNPAGAGSEAAFKSRLGERYVADLDYTARAVHNGYLDMAASWGVQGLGLFLAAIVVSGRALAAAIREARDRQQTADVFLGCCLQAAVVVLLVASIFISSLRGEWFYWWLAMAATFGRFVRAGSEVKAIDNPSQHDLSTRVAWPSASLRITEQS